MDIDIDMDMDMDKDMNMNIGMDKDMNMNIGMEFGTFTFIIPDTIFNRVKKYMQYDFAPDANSQLLFTYDDEPDVVKEFDMKTDHKMKKRFHGRNQFFAQTFQFQTKEGLTLFFEDTPVFLRERGEYVLKSLKQIFHDHVHCANSKPSVYNCVYCVHDPTKQYAFSMLKIGSNRYLFAYQPKYLDKHDVEQIVFDFFIS
jgi:hypothetical protein